MTAKYFLYGNYGDQKKQILIVYSHIHSKQVIAVCIMLEEPWNKPTKNLLSK